MAEVRLFRAAMQDIAADAGIGRILLDDNGRILSADRAACALLGFKDSQAILRSQGEGEAVLADWPALRADAGAAGELLFHRRQCVLRRANGEPVPVLLTAGRSEDGNIDAIIVSCHELHSAQVALQDAEQRYRNLLEQSHNGIFVADGQVFRFVNRAFAEMLAYAPHELLGQDCLEHAHEDDRQIVTPVYASLLEGEAGFSEFTVRLWMKGRIGLREVSVRASRVEYDGTAAILGTVYDITDLRRGEAALRDYARRLRLLSLQVIDVQENERRHLARELHDEIGQQLTLVKLSLEALRNKGQDRQLLDDSLASVSALMQEVRNLSLDLRPSMLDDLGLGATLRWYTSRAATVSGLRVATDIDPAFPRLDPGVETLFFRVAQEAITNAMRHSGADLLQLVLSADDDRIELNITDNGCGFDPAIAGESAMRGGSAGLLGMQERAALGGALLEIESAPGKGTWLRLVIPRARAGFQPDSA